MKLKLHKKINEISEYNMSDLVVIMSKIESAVDTVTKSEFERNTKRKKQE